MKSSLILGVKKKPSAEFKVFLVFIACFSFVLCCNIAHADKGIVATEITEQVENPREILGFKLLDQNPFTPTKDVLSKVKFEKPIKDNGLSWSNLLRIATVVSLQ